VETEALLKANGVDHGDFPQVGSSSLLPFLLPSLFLSLTLHPLFPYPTFLFLWTPLCTFLFFPLDPLSVSLPLPFFPSSFHSPSFPPSLLSSRRCSIACKPRFWRGRKGGAGGGAGGRARRERTWACCGLTTIGLCRRPSWRSGEGGREGGREGEMERERERDRETERQREGGRADGSFQRGSSSLFLLLLFYYLFIFFNHEDVNISLVLRPSLTFFP